MRIPLIPATYRSEATLVIQFNHIVADLALGLA